jgi:hypothetical protein
VASADRFVGQPILAAAAFQAAFSKCDALVFATKDAFRDANREPPAATQARQREFRQELWMLGIVLFYLQSAAIATAHTLCKHYESTRLRVNEFTGFPVGWKSRQISGSWE